MGSVCQKEFSNEFAFLFSLLSLSLTFCQQSFQPLAYFERRIRPLQHIHIQPVQFIIPSILAQRFIQDIDLSLCDLQFRRLERRFVLVLNEFRPHANVAGVRAQLLVERTISIDEILLAEAIDVVAAVADSDFVAFALQVVPAEGSGG